MYSLSSEKAFLRKYDINEGDYSRTGLEWGLLSAIYSSYLEEIPQYKFLENYFLDYLKNAENVHSVETFLKNPEHLIKDIIKNKIKHAGLEVNINNYKELATDLLEVRVLHLFKQDWEAIHEYIIRKWPLKAKPIAYVHKDDNNDLISKFKEKDCEIKHHHYGYSSIYYQAVSRLDAKTSYIEIRVRTLFEEAWSNIDYIIRNSHDINDQILVQNMSYFNRISGMAEEMGTFLYKYLNGRTVRNKIDEQLESPKILLRLENAAKKKALLLDDTQEDTVTEAAPPALIDLQVSAAEEKTPLILDDTQEDTVTEAAPPALIDLQVSAAEEEIPLILDDTQEDTVTEAAPPALIDLQVSAAEEEIPQSIYDREEIELKEVASSIQGDLPENEVDQEAPSFLDEFHENGDAEQEAAVSMNGDQEPLPDAWQVDHDEHQKILNIQPDSFLKARPVVTDTLKDEEKVGTQKFSLSKLKQAIQEISQKNAAQQ